MAEENKMITEDEFDDEEMTVTLNFEDGDVECAVVTIFDLDGKDYIALLPLDEEGDNEEGEVWIYGYSENPDDPNEEPELYFIEDDDEYERASAEFDRLVEESEHDEII